MQVGITINIMEYLPSDFDFTDFNFIFIYDSKQVDKEITYLKKDNIYHKLFIPSKKDIKYSVRMTKNDSLIGLSEFIIPFSILHKRETHYEKLSLITMTDSLKKLIFGSSTSNSQIKINIHSSLRYFGKDGYIKEKYLRKNKSNINKEIYEKKVVSNLKEPKSNRIFKFKSEINNNSLSINKEQNSISNRNILKSQKVCLQNQHSNPFPHTQVVSPKRHLIYNMPGTELKKNTHINLIKEINKNIEELTETNINDEDPNDNSVIDKDLETGQKYGEQKLYEFINNLIKENPLSELDNKKDIGEMIIYTKDIVDQLLDYQIKFYDTLKKSIELNHKFNELLLKYNEKYRYVIKKMNKLKEENNTFDMKSNIIVNNNKNDIKEIISIKNKELDIFKNIYKIENEENELNYDNNNIQLKILLNALQKISSKYGALNKLITNKNSSENEIKNLNYLFNKYKEELNESKYNNIKNEKENEIKINDDNQNQNKNENEGGDIGLEYVLNDNPDELDKILNKNLKNIYNNNNVNKIILKRIGKNSYEYGKKKILVKKDDNNIKVRIGGLFVSLDKFIESVSTENGKKNAQKKKFK